MFCENCGEKISKEDAFCTNCGHKISHENSDVTEEKQSSEQIVEQDVSKTTTEEVVTNNDTKTEQVENVINQNSNNNFQKENIKKGSTGKVFLTILILLIVLAIIGIVLYFFVFKKNDNAIEVIQKATDNMSDFDSYTTVINGELAINGDESVDASFNLETNVDVKNNISKLNIQITANGVSVEMPAYIDLSDEENGYVYFKFPAALGIADGWSKISLGQLSLNDIVDNADTNDKLDVNVDKLNDIGFIKEKKSDDKDCYYYEITINEENLKKIADIYEDLGLTDSEIEEMNIGEGFVIDVYVNKKQNYISKFKFDIADFINKLSNNELKFEKLNLSIEFKDINKVSEIVIPSEAKNAEEIDLDSLYDDTTTLPNSTDDDEENYVDDYTITDYGFTVKYTMPTGFRASSVNSEDFKIYHSDELDVAISNYWEDATERFEDIEYDKSFYEEEDNYKNVVLSEEKNLKYNGKDFVYKELSYESDSTKYYKTTVCYQLDDEHVYRVEYEKNDKPITEEELKLFLDITVNK